MKKSTAIISSKPTSDEKLFNIAKKPRSYSDIINISEIKINIETAWKNTDTPEEFKGLLLQIFRETLVDGSGVIKRRFLDKNNGAATVL